MAAWTNHKATSIAKKEIRRGRLTKPVKPTDLQQNPGAKAVEGKHQDAAIHAAEILAGSLLGGFGPSQADRSHATITMSGTSTNPPAIGDTISVAVTIAAPQASETEAAVAGRV